MTATITPAVVRRRPGPARQPRFPLEPLKQAAGAANNCHLARMLGVHRGIVQRWAREGIVRHAADRSAIAVGLHPANIWPEFVEETN